MYWPCGVPKLYAHAGNDDSETNPDQNEHEEGEERPNGSIENGEEESIPEKANGFSSSLIGLKIARLDHIFVTISEACLLLWSSRPTAVLARAARSVSSMNSYGSNVRVLLRPDASIVVVQTASGHLFTYSIEYNVQGRVYQQQNEHSQARRQSLVKQYGVDEGAGLREVTIRFRRAIKIDAGVNAALALDEELLVSTARPPAVQCIRWAPDETGSQTSAELVSKMNWTSKKSTISAMVYDRAMSLSVWIGSEGRAYAVQRVKKQRLNSVSSESSMSSMQSTSSSRKLFNGFCFHEPATEDDHAVKAAINARFSLLAISCTGGEIFVYAAKNYAGNIPLSHKMALPGSAALIGKLTCLSWSPDGYCLFAGFEKGWACWSVYGKEGASTFNANHQLAEANNENWLLGVSSANWTSGGSEILLTAPEDDRIWKLDFSRSAAVGCFSCANFVRALLQTPSELIIYRGHDMPDLTAISNEASLWLHAPYPPAYLHNQWPIKTSIISQDGRYVAIAGRRGLAHYSISSGRWKAFTNSVTENSFAVRGGMAWIGHVLAAATESEGSYELRLYSRDKDLSSSSALHIETLPAPVIFVGPSGEDSLLVYTHDNVLYHYVVNLTEQGANIVLVGQITFHGVVRAPTRVRSLSWILPGPQLRDGDPSRDVEYASVLFLVDDKLVLLQPSRTEEGSLKYDMRVIAQHVEYYILMRDQVHSNFAGLGDESAPQTPSPGMSLTEMRAHNSLRDSLWVFGGDYFRVWSDVREVLHHAPEDQPNPSFSSSSSMLTIPVDFYPLSILLTKGIILGIEADLIQRRDVNFAQLRSSIRTHLFLPHILRHQLCDSDDITSALALAQQYSHLSYFPHALEILLHHVLDSEVDCVQTHTNTNGSPSPSPSTTLPAILSFLSTVLPPSTYLSTLVQCIRKTEISSWPTLFTHLPPPTELFESALALNDLRTASGYLIILQSFEEEVVDEVEVEVEVEVVKEGEEKEKYDLDMARLESYAVRLMALARQQADFELCSDLARFLMALDPRGGALRRVVEKVGFRSEAEVEMVPPATVGRAKQVGLGLQIPDEGALRRQEKGRSPSPRRSPAGSRPDSAGSAGGGGDYFSASPGDY